MPNSFLIILPLLIYVFGAVLCFFFYGNVRVQQIISLMATALSFVCAVFLLKEVTVHGIISMQVGGWTSPFGISVVVDLLPALMICVTTLLAFAVSLFSLSSFSINYSRQRKGYHPSLLFMLAGIVGSFITGDLFNLYVWFEVMLISSFVLITLGSERKQLEGGLKYMVLNFVASTFLLLAIAVLYGITGHTNMAALAMDLQRPSISGMAQVASMLLLVSFAAKAAMFPLFFWLPASYHTPPIAVTTIIAGLLTKVGVYTLLRTYTLLFPIGGQEFTTSVLMVMACFTMLAGVLGALVQQDIRKVLAYNLISKIGFIIMGLAINTKLGIAAAIFYTVHHILVKGNLFFVAGLIGAAKGSFQLQKLRGIYDELPLLSFVFMLLSLALVGIPPLSGFYGKLMFVEAGFSTSNYIPIAIMLLTSLLTLYSMIRVWSTAFLKKEDEEGSSTEKMNEGKFMAKNKPMYAAVALLLVFTLAISIYATPLVDISLDAAEQLLDRDLYIGEVMK